MGWINARTLRAYGMAVPALSLIFFWFLDAKLNLWETGVTPGALLGIANILLVYFIYKNKI